MSLQYMPGPTCNAICQAKLTTAIHARPKLPLQYNTCQANLAAAIHARPNLPLQHMLGQLATAVHARPNLPLQYMLGQLATAVHARPNLPLQYMPGQTYHCNMPGLTCHCKVICQAKLATAICQAKLANAMQTCTAPNFHCNTIIMQILPLQYSTRPHVLTHCIHIIKQHSPNDAKQY